MRVVPLALLLLVAPALAQERYREPVVFGRSHNDPATGRKILQSKIWLMDSDGSKLRALTEGETYDDHPSLYSDLQHVLYSEFPVNRLDIKAGAKLIKLNIYTGARETVAEAPGCALHHASLSPFADLLAYHRDCGPRRSQWIGWGPDAYEVPTIATNGVAVPGGILYMSEKNRGVPGLREVAIARLEGRGRGATVTLLTDDTVLHRRPAISPNGKQIAWQTNAAGPEDEIFLAESDGSNPRNLTKGPGNDGHPWFSRDGRTLVFESDRTGTWEIWRYDFASGQSRQLTFGGKAFESTRPRM
ncbi:MAG: PD40 domain-containing protein [Bryobacterales bacterium]|nr:PD40 domain-containing protein [Bryobacterales bacterium]